MTNDLYLTQINAERRNYSLGNDLAWILSAFVPSSQDTSEQKMARKRTTQ